MCIRDSIYTFGTAGEGYGVDDEMFTEMTTVFADELKNTDVTPITGVISLSQAEMINRLNIAYELGIRDFQISFPSWGALTDEEAVSYTHLDVYKRQNGKINVLSSTIQFSQIPSAISFLSSSLTISSNVTMDPL